MTFRPEFAAAGVGLLLAAGLALSQAGWGTLGTWDEETVASAEAGEEPKAALPPFGAPSIDAQSLMEALLAGEPGLTVADVRAEAATASDRIAPAYPLPLDDQGWQPPGPFPPHRRIVLVASDGPAADAAWQRIAPLGYQDLTVLEGGQAAWNAMYGDLQEPGEDATPEQWRQHQARRAAALYLAGGYEALQAGASDGAPPPVAAPPPMPVRRSSAAAPAIEGC